MITTFLARTDLNPIKDTDVKDKMGELLDVLPRYMLAEKLVVNKRFLRDDEEYYLYTLYFDREPDMAPNRIRDVQVINFYCDIESTICTSIKKAVMINVLQSIIAGYYQAREIFEK